MTTISSTVHAFATTLLLTAALATGCAPGDTSPDEASIDAPGASDGDEQALGEAASAITSGDLSTLLMGKALPVTQGYLPNGQHAGIDFGSTGDGVTSVSAPINGTIAANTSACGKVAIFDGVNTLIFAHMTARTGLAVGSAITTGTYLGKASQVVGGGCSASGPHLHMEIRTGNNTNMALPSANNSATTLNPLTYQYGPFAAVSLVSPAANATLPGNPANVPFQWTAVQGASTYRIQVSQGGFSGDNCVGPCSNITTSAAQATINMPAAGAYSWRVRAGSSYTGGFWSAVRKVTK